MSALDPLSALSNATQVMSTAASKPPLDPTAISKLLGVLIQQAGTLSPEIVDSLSGLKPILDAQLRSEQIGTAKSKTLIDALAKLETIQNGTGNKIRLQDNAARIGMKKKLLDARLAAAADPVKGALREDIRAKKRHMLNTKQAMLQALAKGNWSAEKMAALLGAIDQEGTGQPGLLKSLMDQKIPHAENTFFDLSTAHDETVNRIAKQVLEDLKKQSQTAGTPIYDAEALEKRLRSAVRAKGGVPDAAIQAEALREQTAHPGLAAQIADQTMTDEALKVKGNWLHNAPEMPTSEAIANGLVNGKLNEQGDVVGTPKRYSTAAELAEDVNKARKQNAETARKGVRNASIAKGAAGVGIATLVGWLVNNAMSGSKDKGSSDPRVLQQLLAQQMMQQKAGMELKGNELLNLNRMLSALQKLKDIQGAQVIPAASPGIM